MKIKVKSKVEGFRRAGRAWSTDEIIVESDEFTKEQIKVLKNDPDLVVVEAGSETPETKSSDNKAVDKAVTAALKKAEVEKDAAVQDAVEKAQAEHAKAIEDLQKTAEADKAQAVKDAVETALKDVPAPAAKGKK